MFVLSPRLRRLVYALSFEALAIVLSTAVLTWLSGAEASGSLLVSVAVTLIALIWNLIYNAGFEAAEHRLRLTRRGFVLRALHAVGFEGGLFLFTVPLYMLWYRVGFAQAVAMEAALLVFFVVYTFVFTWVFDQLFVRPVPLSRQMARG